MSIQVLENQPFFKGGLGWDTSEKSEFYAKYKCIFSVKEQFNKGIPGKPSALESQKN